MLNFQIDQTLTKKEIKLKDLYDVIIIGGGPGALNAALYSARSGLTTLVVAYEVGGQLLNTNIIDNYLGFYNVSGEELNQKFLSHLRNFAVDELYQVKVDNIRKVDNIFHLTLNNKKIIKGRGVILATGGLPRKLNVPGEKEFTSKGVSYCVICDGTFYGDQMVVVVGGGNSALEAALDLSKYAKKVHIVQNLDDFTGDKILINKVKNLPNVTYQFNSVLTQIKGENKVSSILVKQNETISEIETNGLFIQIGLIPSSELVKDLVSLNRFSEVIVNDKQETSLKGLYAIGDVTNFPYKQVVTAISQGAVAALSLNKYLNK
ncbi:MAG: FAD-dependent oxidoreductase [Bacilli bacterium]|jgi:thioredoxin-disulfide reductase|nr:FAD-dependent oxidoreductase [Bacilli bacterium]NLN80157.1 FAD-dependent oxidoreductase [Erysipelotrichia bacterium]